MNPTADELAGIVDLFGALTREEIHEAVENLAARAGSEFDPDAVEDRIDEAVDTYALVPIGDDLFAPGPAAFPTLPDHGGDLPHMMDVPERATDRERLAEIVGEELRGKAATAVETGEEDRIEGLLDLCYEVEAWGPIDLSETRERLADALEG